MKKHLIQLAVVAGLAQLPLGTALAQWQPADETLDVKQRRAAFDRINRQFSVLVTVTNTGDVAGDEVVQVYLRDEISSVTRPVKELAGFQRVTLQPGESHAVSIPIEPRSLMMWNREMERVIEPGDFTIMVGPNSQDLQDVTLTVVP